ncbi:MAG TPA: NAD-dependent epimerase/dehydratase family protein [Chloroflexota bacterium]|jgi:UDP-glucose 4-epimerase|nr:NAD-dependent epimerase/dehydratase family protein [Chloroflexota bacterium]
MRALITGGAGFIGSHLTDHLLARGATVWALDDLSTGARANVAHHATSPRFRLVEGSVLDRALVEELVAQCDAVYHLAAAVGVRRILAEARRAIEINLRGTEHVLAAAARRGCPVLVTSTSEVYGKNDRGPLREDDDAIMGPTRTTRWLYAITKAADECLALAYAREYGLPVVVVRLFNTIGPRQTGAYGMVVPRLVGQALRGEPLTVYGDGQQTRCFTYVDDVVAAIEALLATPAARGEVVNVGQPREVTIEQLARLIRDLAGSASPIVHVPYEQAYGAGFEDMRRRVPDISKLQRLTGFVPRVPLEEALRRIIDHAQARYDRAAP